MTARVTKVKSAGGVKDSTYLDPDIPAADMLPQLKTALPGDRARKVLADDQRLISPSYTRGYPLVAETGRGCVVWDVDGNRFLDFNAGIAVLTTGHCHPKVVKALQDQAAQLIHMSGTDFYYRAQTEVAERLTAVVPIKGPKKVFLANSGTEAVECALKLARYVTGRSHFLSFYGAFHGRTMGSLSVSSSKYVHRKGFGPLLSDVTAIPYGYCYRCPVNRSYPGCNVECLDVIEQQIFPRRVSPTEFAAIIVEPVQGEGGYVPAPREFLQRLRGICDKHGIMLIFDEVQSGMGRTGKYFASEHTGVVADIYAIAKGIASGMPLGAVVASEKTMTWPPGTHASTFGGNPLSCAAAVATLELLDGGLLEHGRAMGEILKERLVEVGRKHSVVGDVRGMGLMIGMEFVTDPVTRAPSGKLRDEVVDGCFARGLLLLGCGPNTLRFCPPLVVTREQVEWAAKVVDEELTRLTRKAPPRK